jgi:hypothetical protein
MLMRALRAISLVCLLVLLLGASSCVLDRATAQSSPTTTAFSQPTALPTATPGALPPAVTGPLASVPTDCATVDPPNTFTLPSDFGGGFFGDFTFSGSSPAWALGPGSPLHVEQPSAQQPYPSTKVMWIVGPNYILPVTLSGRELRSNAPLWFEVYAGGALATSVFTTSATLDPGSPNRGSAAPRSGHWNIWGIGLLVLSAGCYELDVTWSGGSWRTVYAAGA